MTNINYQDFSKVVDDAVHRLIKKINSPHILPPPEYFGTKQASVYLSISPAQLEIWRCRGGGPKYTKLAHVVRYKVSDLDEFMLAKRQSNTEGGSHE